MILMNIDHSIKALAVVRIAMMKMIKKWQITTAIAFDQ